MKNKQALIALLCGCIALAACEKSPKEDATGKSSASAPAPAAASNGRIETFGKNSPAIVSASGDVSITYDGKQTPPDGPKVVENVPFSAVTHGDNSPVVAVKGGSVTINYK